MKVISTIIVIFLAQCVLYLHASILPDFVKSTANSVSDKVVNSCIFGVKSVGIILYNSENPEGKVIKINETTDVINKNESVVFVVHGFLSNANRTISNKLCKTLVEDGYTVLSLDWSDGACTNGIPGINSLEYPQAVINTRAVGEYMATYVEWLIKKCEIPLKKITFIGHSLGAHVCGFAAKKIQELGLGTITRIIAADPAQPLFAWKNCKERLCKTDAVQVFALFTSVLGINPYRPGLKPTLKPEVAHVHLQFGDGVLQPECFPLDVACSHSKSIDYILGIWKGCEMLAVPMSSPHKYPDQNTTNCTYVTKNMLTADPFEKDFYVFVKPYCVEENSFKCQSSK